MAKNYSLRGSISIAVSFVALLWGIKLSEVVLGLDLHHLALYPRTQSGLLGILTAPLIHGSWQHLFGNSLPTVVLTSMLLYGYPRSRYRALLTIWLLCGIGVWLFARSSYHLGASGITHGLFFYLFVGGILRRDKRSAAILMIVFYMYGGMLLTIFPGDPGVSFESHFFGAFAGALSAYVWRNRDPKPARKRYAWQSEPDEDDPVIGDQWRASND
jgi:membrane associated rhomboid family serine protease